MIILLLLFYLKHMKNKYKYKYYGLILNRSRQPLMLTSFHLLSFHNREAVICPAPSPGAHRRK